MRSIFPSRKTVANTHFFATTKLYSYIHNCNMILTIFNLILDALFNFLWREMRNTAHISFPEFLAVDLPLWFVISIISESRNKLLSTLFLYECFIYHSFRQTTNEVSLLKCWMNVFKQILSGTCEVDVVQNKVMQFFKIIKKELSFIPFELLFLLTCMIMCF